MEKNKILIVDDNEDIREVISVLLSAEGYETCEAENGRLAIDMLREEGDYKLVLLDIMMPEVSGIEACKEMRTFSDVPILFLTAKSQNSDKVEAYTEGGDDYLVKPFSQTELVMKVKSLLRRYMEYNKSVGSTEVVMLDNNTSLNMHKRILKRGEEVISITDKEFEILRFFIENRGSVVDVKSLYEGVWGEQYLPSAANTIMVHILNLRKKIEEDTNNPKYIKTVWGKGYKLENR